MLSNKWELCEGKCVFLTQKPGSHQRRVPRTEGGNASIVVPSLWSKNLEKLELVCVHGYENAFLWHKSQGHIKEGYLLEFRKLWYLDSKLDKYNWIRVKYSSFLGSPRKLDTSSLMCEHPSEPIFRAREKCIRKVHKKSAKLGPPRQPCRAHYHGYPSELLCALVV